MIFSQSTTICDRKQAGRLLAEKLGQYKNSEAIVIAIPYGGVHVGYQLAKELHLQFDVVPCKKIMHPANRRKGIGSVSTDEVVIHEGTKEVPHDYIYHQIIVNQNAVKVQRLFFNTRAGHLNVRGKTVILVMDRLCCTDAIMACLNNIRNRKPKEIIVAVPVVTQEAASKLLDKADGLVLLEIENIIRIENFYEEHLHINDYEVRDLIIRAMKEFNQG